MSQNKDPFCLGCHWEAFHLDDGRGPDDAPDASQQPQWDCEHHAHDHCDFDEACCDMDDCSEHCGSVCDGFVDCDASTACTVSHCEDTHCEDTGPVCFDEYCFGPDADHGLESWLGFGGPGPGPGPGPVPLDNDLLSTAEHGQPAKTDSAGPEHADAGSLLMMPYSTGNYCDHPGSHFDCHFDCHFDPKDPGVNPSYPAGVDPAEVFHMLGMCPDFSSCHSYLPDGHSCHSSGNLPDEHSCQSSSGKLGGGNLPSTPFPCLHSEYPGHSPRGKKDLIGDSPAQGPCRQHRCRVQPHAHSHAFSPYSRHPRSSHLLPSPSETPPLTPTPSVLTGREFSADSEVHMCKWTTSNDGAKRSCGAAFSDPGSLQEHLVAKHLSTVDGPKGNGYYCCWEGCYRPGEPFSQKSKLQGHFLTHSNRTSIAMLMLMLMIHTYGLQTKTSDARCAASRSRGMRHWSGTNAATAARNRSRARTAGSHLRTAAS
jgi:hypothetical protein